MPPTIFVVAATGTLGKAVALELLGAGWAVHATTRDPTSAAARELAAAGARLFAGDWDDGAALRAAASGCEGLFLNLAPSFADAEADARQGEAIVAIARAAGVRHVVYAGGVPAMLEEIAEADEGLVATFMRNKRRVEAAVRAAGFDAHTVLRPAGFMANWVAPKARGMFAGLAETGTLETALRPDTVVVSVDERDVAAFAAAAFRDPARFRPAAATGVPVASEAHTTEDILAALSRASGKTLRAAYMDDREAAARARVDPFVQGQLLSRGLARAFDMDAVRAWGIPLHSFREWLEREKDAVEMTYGHLE